MVIDASFWVAIFVENDAHYSEATEFLESALDPQQPFHIPALALAEVGGAIARKTGDKKAAELAVQYLVSQPWIDIHQGSEEISRGAARIAIGCMLRGADATYVALAQNLGVPLITRDREIYERGPAVARILMPREWLQQTKTARK
jgi:predicted nucleic acid-binding protein